MFPTRAVLGALSVVALIATQARTEEKEKEPDAILEIGGSGNWSLSGPSSFGPTVAIEFTPIENWLEIEVGTGPMFGKGISEWDTDIVFKKPFTLSDKVEIMIGAGPQWGNAFKHGFAGHDNEQRTWQGTAQHCTVPLTHRCPLGCPY